jgi:hypothetical protein
MTIMPGAFLKPPFSIQLKKLCPYPDNGKGKIGDSTDICEK